MRKTAILLLCLALAATGAHGRSIKRLPRPGTPISNMVTVPAGYDTTFISGTSAGSGGFTIPDGADTEAQVSIVYDHFRTWLAAEGLGLGDIVMLRVFLKPDPAKGGKIDTAGANAAFARFFGTPDQPALPARITLPADLAGKAMAEIEAVVAHERK